MHLSERSIVQAQAVPGVGRTEWDPEGGSLGELHCWGYFSSDFALS